MVSERVLRLSNSLGGQLDGVISMVTQSAQFGTPPQALEAMINTILENQFSGLRDEFRALTPELETVKRQGAQMLRAQALQGDMLRQIQDQLDAALAFNAPLADEGVVGPQVSIFLGSTRTLSGCTIKRRFSGCRGGS